MSGVDYREALLNLGYSNISEDAKNFRMKPLYRDSSSNTVLSVRKDTGYFIDFSRSLSGTFADLVKISLGLKDISEAEIWMKEKRALPNPDAEKPKPKVSGGKILPKELLDKVIPDHSYWIKRGISMSTVATFDGGIVKSGRMANRYVFPIFNYKKDLIGITGRYTLKIPKDSKISKWLHFGGTSQWKYPLQKNNKIILNEKKVILVESIGDMLSLWEAGVKNVIVTFGLNISLSIINYLLKIDIENIVISFNKDESMRGQDAAVKNSDRLKRYFDEDQILIKLPTKNDFGDMDKQEIIEWSKKINTYLHQG